LLQYKKMNIPIELLQIITNYSNFRIQIRIIKINQNINIYNLTNKKITDEIIKQKYYKDLIKLDCNNNKNITNINHLKNLQILNAFMNSKIDDNGIKD